MSLYNIQSNSTQNALKANWKTNSTTTRLNKRDRQIMYPFLGGFSDPGNPIGFQFSNDRIITNNDIISSQNSLNKFVKDSIVSNRNINLILSPNVTKAILFKGKNDNSLVTFKTS
jgi:hypothetical protein